MCQTQLVEGFETYPLRLSFPSSPEPKTLEVLTPQLTSINLRKLRDEDSMCEHAIKCTGRTDLRQIWDNAVSVSKCNSFRHFPASNIGITMRKTND